MSAELGIAKDKLLNLMNRLPGTEVVCWGIGQSNKQHSGGGRCYYGVIDRVDAQDPSKLHIRDGNIVEILLHFRPGDHVVTLREAAESNTADFTTYIECGFDFDKMKPLMLLDLVRDILA